MGMPRGWRSTSDCPEESKSPMPFTKQKPAFAPKEAMRHLIQRTQLWKFALIVTHVSILIRQETYLKGLGSL